MLPKKIIFIELDGGSWNVMEPLLRAGKLPHLARMVQDGSHGELLSDPPLISPRLWVSIFSGKRSSGHGVEFFGSSSEMVRCKRLWDILQDEGLTVGVFGSFVTWPPAPVRGFMIPNLFALGPETQPPSYRFFQELTLAQRKKGKPGTLGHVPRRSPLYYAAKLKSHGVSWSTLGAGAVQLAAAALPGGSPEHRYWRKALLHMRISGEIFAHLWRRYEPGFATLHLHACDALAHRYWKYYEPDGFEGVSHREAKRLGGVIPASYIEADRIIGKIRKLAPDAVFVILSDHGSEGLALQRSAYVLRVEPFLKRLRLTEGVIPANVGLLTFLHFANPQRMEEIRQVLTEAAMADTGEKVFEVMDESSLLGVRLSQEHWGTTIAPDRALRLGSLGDSTFGEFFTAGRTEVSGTHKLEGILIMDGPGVRKGIRLEPSSIFDVAPTTLALLGLPTARDMDGTVIEAALTDELLRERPLRNVDSYEQGSSTQAESKGASYEEIKGTLQSLGYL